VLALFGYIGAYDQSDWAPGAGIRLLTAPKVAIRKSYVTSVIFAIFRHRHRGLANEAAFRIALIAQLASRKPDPQDCLCFTNDANGDAPPLRRS
jgi:hypothetical protein